jgi:transposase-like protein
MEKKTVNKKHRKYDENFKSEALKMTKSRSVAEVARSMGIG